MQQGMVYKQPKMKRIKETSSNREIQITANIGFLITKVLYVRYNSNNSNTFYPNPFPPLFLLVPIFISTWHCSLVTQTLSVCDKLLTIPP